MRTQPWICVLSFDMHAELICGFFFTCKTVNEIIDNNNYILFKIVEMSLSYSWKFWKSVCFHRPFIRIRPKTIDTYGKRVFMKNVQKLF